MAAADKEASVLISNVRDHSISNAFFLATMQDSAGNYADSLKSIEHVVDNSRKLLGEKHWRTIEYNLKLGKAKWLVKASQDQIINGLRQETRTVTG